MAFTRWLEGGRAEVLWFLLSDCGCGREGVGPGKRGNELTSWHRDAKRRGFAAMARKMRIEYAGAAYHVMARGEGG
jgi:hypothetical protein